MRKYWYLLIILAFGFEAGATHLIGGYMSYQYLGRNADGDYDYKVTLHVFRDRAQSTVDFDEQIELGVHLNNNTLQLHRPFPINLIFRRRVDPPGSTDCDYYLDKVNIEQGFYEAVISLPPNSVGYHLTFVRCCRNFQDNLTNRDGRPFQGQTYYCFIPNPQIRNSSPFFSGVPSPYMCAKDTNVFLNRAIDPDGDSLVYRFVWPFQGGAPTDGGAMPSPPPNLQLPIDSVFYQTGYSYTRPFGAGTFIKIDNSNGLTTLYAPRPGSYVVAIEVLEYRNGQLLSRVRLDLQILVLDCPPNEQPKVVVPTGYRYEVEAGQQLCFDVEGFDPDGDNVKISGDGDIFTGENGFKAPLATLLERSGRRTVSSEFCWTPSCDQARDEPYVFTVIVEDDGCPPKNDKKNIEIIVKKFEGSLKINGPQRVCSGNNEVYAYSADKPKTTSTFYWEVIGGTAVGLTPGSDILVDWNSSASKGLVRMVEISEFNCPGDTVELIVDLIPSPPPPVITGPDTVCLDASGVVYSIAPKPGSTFQWLISGGVIQSNTNTTANVLWNNLGDHYIAAIERGPNGCFSDTSFYPVNVRKPGPGISGPLSVCPNATGIEYFSQRNRGSSYLWTVQGGNTASPNGTDRIQINWGDVGNGSIDLVETDRFGCSSDPISIMVIIDHNLRGQVPVGDNKVCDNEGALPYSVFPSQGSVYNWDITNGTQQSGDSSNAITVLWPNAGSGRVGVQESAFDAVNNKACVSPWLYLDIDIFPSPTAREIEGDFDLCEGPDTFVYTVRGMPGSTYAWTVNGNAAGISGQGSNSIRLAWPIAGNYTIEVVELTKDSCLGELIDSVVLVHPKPTTKGIFGDAVLCYPDVLAKTYSVQGFANSTYAWTYSGGGSTGSTSDTLIVDWSSNGTGLIRVVETSEFTCVGDTLELPVVVSRMEIDLKVVSVGFPDDRISGKFGQTYDDLRTGDFEIQRRRAGTGDVWQTILSESFTNFLDLGLNTDEFAWEYRIRAVDLCGVEHFSEPHTNVWLRGSQSEDDFDIFLNFSPYLGWDNGVRRYELYSKTNESNSFEYVQDADPGSTIFIDGNSEEFKRCYRIKAIEQDGGNEVSWSNELCFFFNPNVYVPNAFTPNQDQINQTFNPVTVAIKDYEISIYNRWGEEVFNSTDKEIDWDGTYKGQDCAGGVYVYHIRYSDYQDKQYQLRGTVHLLR
ncbi:MAG: gliding motility-associated C-terminal domain-containing protein [Flavobacteriales bacterium]|nr:gliding motility-associated C-terminal domain-containing protein [Flavobacteriales bacterium]